MRKAKAPALVELLLLVRPLIDQTRGDKREALSRAWINAFNNMVTEMFGLDEGRLPTSKRGAIEALMRLSLQLAKDDGMSGMDLLQFYNRTADSGALIELIDHDQAITRGFGLLGVMAALNFAPQQPTESADEGSQPIAIERSA
jgi:hypothetical protein